MNETNSAPTMKLMKGSKTAAPAATAATPAAPAATPAQKPAAAVQTVKNEAKAKLLAEVDTSQGQSIQVEDLITKTVHEIENMKEDKAFKAVPALLNNIDHDFFRLGGVLSVIKAQGWHMDRGFESFKAYVEAELPDVGYRKAVYLIGIYNGLVESGVKWESVKHLGWTKLKEIAGILTPENVEEWVTVAEGMTTLQLIDHVKASSAGVGAGSVNPVLVTQASNATVTMTFKLHKDQKATIQAALEKAMHEAGTTVSTVALEYIALDYLGGSKLKQVPTLHEMMVSRDLNDVLSELGKAFPDISLTVTVPEEDLEELGLSEG